MVGEREGEELPQPLSIADRSKQSGKGLVLVLVLELAPVLQVAYSE